MNITANAISKLVRSQKFTPMNVQVLKVEKTDKNPFIVKLIVSDGAHSILSLTKCKTEDEATTLKQFCLIKIKDGSLIVPKESSTQPLVLNCSQFEILNNHISKQLGSDIVHLRAIKDLSINSVSKKVQSTNTSTTSIDLSGEKITPLAFLTQTNTKFVVKGNVVSKSDKIEYSGGHLFNFTIQDKNGDELKCICFGDVCDKYFHSINENETYYISKGNLKPPRNTNFRNEKMIDLDCTITSYTIIQKSSDAIPRTSKITEIEKLGDCAVDKLYSICCKIDSIGETEKVNDKSKRVIKVVDQSNWKIEINFWGELTGIPDEFSVDQIVQFDDVKLIEFNYKSLNYSKSSKCIVSPSSDEAKKLKQFLKYDDLESAEDFSNLKTYSPKPLKPLKTLKEYEEAVRNADGNPFFTDVIAYVTAFRTDSISYFACDHCKKKVDVGVDVTVCPNCEKPCTPQHQYNLKASVSDSTTTVWGTMFDKVALKFMEKPANELVELKETNPDQYDEFFQNKTHTHVIVGLSGKLETYQEQESIRTTIVFIGNPIDYSRASKELTDAILKDIEK
ncbi:Replication factor A protein 1 [Entamoeba marina]